MEACGFAEKRRDFERLSASNRSIDMQEKGGTHPTFFSHRIPPFLVCSPSVSASTPPSLDIYRTPVVFSQVPSDGHSSDMGPPSNETSKLEQPAFLGVVRRVNKRTRSIGIVYSSADKCRTDENGTRENEVIVIEDDPPKFKHPPVKRRAADNANNIGREVKEKVKKDRTPPSSKDTPQDSPSKPSSNLPKEQTKDSKNGVMKKDLKKCIMCDHIAKGVTCCSCKRHAKKLGVRVDGGEKENFSISCIRGHTIYCRWDGKVKLKCPVCTHQNELRKSAVRDAVREDEKYSALMKKKQALLFQQAKEKMREDRGSRSVKRNPRSPSSKHTSQSSSTKTVESTSGLIERLASMPKDCPPWVVLGIEVPMFVHSPRKYIVAKEAYKRMVVKVHPDKNSHPQAAEAFRRVLAALRQIDDVCRKQ